MALRKAQRVVDNIILVTNILVPFYRQIINMTLIKDGTKESHLKDRSNRSSAQIEDAKTMFPFPGNQMHTQELSIILVE